MAEAGLEYVPIRNASRHSPAFALRQVGADMSSIDHVLGQANPLVTARHYVEDDLALTANLLGRVADQMLAKPQTGSAGGGS